MSDSGLVDVTLRIDSRNLASLLEEHHPTLEVWLEELEPGVYALMASTAIGFQASRDLPNHEPDAWINHAGPEAKRKLAAKWDELTSRRQGESHD